MASTLIGSLRVMLGMDAGEFKKGSKEAEATLASLGARFSKTSTGISSASAGMLTSLAGVGISLAGLSSALASMDKLNKLSQSLGLTTEELSKLAYAASMSGVDVDELAKGVKKLDVYLAEIGRGDTGSEAAKALTAIGVSAVTASGQVRSAADVMRDIAGKFETYKDSANKTALAVALFGKNGAALIPTLNAGKKGLEEFDAEARQFGLVLDKDSTRAAETFHDNLERIGHITKGILTQALVAVLPELVRLSDGFITSAKSGTILKDAAGTLVFVFRDMQVGMLYLQQSAHYLSNKFEVLGATWDALKNAWSDENASIKLRDRLQALADDTEKTERDTSERIKAIYAGRISVYEAAADAKAKVDAPSPVSNKSAAEEQKKQNEAIAYGKKIAEQYRTPMEQIVFTEGRLKDAVDRRALSQEMANRALADSAVYGRKNMDALASSVSGNLSTIFGDTKAVAVATALINTYQGVTKALADYPPPVSFAMAGIQLAAGMAQVANIRNTTKSSSGGAGSTGGGSAQAAAATAAPPQTLMVQGINANQFFSGGAVKDLAKVLIDFQRDGGKVVLQ